MKLRCLFFAVSLFLTSATTFAGSIAGGTISYRAIDSVTYEVTTLVYVQCDTVAFTPSDTLFVSWQGGGFATNMTLVGSHDVTGTFDKCSVGSNCNGSGNYYLGINEFTFKGTVNISSTACLVTFSYKDGTRSSYITTGPANTDFYISAQVNKCIGMNSSSHITLPPHFILPVGQDAQINCGFIDTVDGDSMGFRIAAAQSALGTNVNHSGSFSTTIPITFLGFPYAGLPSPAGFNIDSATSQLDFRPVKQNEVSVIVIEAIEYRKYGGVMVEIGRTRLEHLIIIQPTPNNLTPKFAGYGEGSVCIGSQICFQVNTDDKDAGDTTHILWNHGIKGSSFTPNTNDRFAGGTFCWTPTDADVRNWPHYVTMRVHDEGCSPNAMTTRTFGIMVYKKIDSAYLEIERKEVVCNTLSLKMKKQQTPDVKRKFASTDGILYINTADSAEILFSKTGWNKYSITTTFNGTCTDLFLDSVWIQTANGLQIHATPDTTVCPNDSFTIAAVPTNSIAPYTYTWLPNNVNINGFVTSVTKNTNYFLNVKDSNGCRVLDTVRVTLHSLPAIKFLHAENTCGNDSPFVLSAIPHSGIWSGTSSGFASPDMFMPKLASVGSDTINYLLIDSNGCKVSKNSVITVNPYSVADFYITPTIGHAPMQADFVATTTPIADVFLWTITNTGSNQTDTAIRSDSVFHYTFNDTGRYTITLTTILGACTDFITKNNYVTVGPLTGVKQTNQNNFNISPNPLPSGYVLVVEGELISFFSLYDAMGKEIEIGKETVSSTKTNINTSGLFPGVYLLNISMKHGAVETYKIVITP